MTLWLQNTPKLSGTVVHLGWSLWPVRFDRPLSGRVVVSLGGQPGTLDRRFSVKTQLTVDLPLRRSSHGHSSSASLLARANVLDLWLQLDVPGFRLVRARGGHGHTLVAWIGPHMDHKLRRSSSARLRCRRNLRRSRPRWACAGAPCILHGRPLAPIPTPLGRRHG